jgi:EF hand
LPPGKIREKGPTNWLITCSCILLRDPLARGRILSKAMRSPASTKIGGLARSPAICTVPFTFFRRKSMRYVLLTCGLTVAISAFAEPGVPNGPQEIQALDTDGDKLISLAEAQQSAPWLASHFEELDTNHDGLLSSAELPERQPMRGVRFTRNLEDDFSAADTNTDGRLSRAEADAAMPIVSDFFDEMDANKDGYVTTAEIHEHAKSHGPIRIFKERGPATAKE